VSVVPPDQMPSSPEATNEPSAVVSDLARLRMLSRIAEQVGEGVVVADNDGWFQYVNLEFAAQHAGTVEELTGAHMSSFYREEALATQVQPIIAAALEYGIGRGEVTRLRRDGTQFPAHITLSLLRDDTGALIGRVLCVQDITKQRQLEEELRQAALYDPLTRLPNRRLLRDRVEHALVLRARGHTGVAALFVDIDSFKRVNDTFGHTVGDQVLKEFAALIRKMVRDEDIAARWGGEEFIILLSHTACEAAAALAERIRSNFEQSPSSAAPLVITASFGVAQLQEGEHEDALIRRTDNALYRAKHEGRNRVVTAGA